MKITILVDCLRLTLLYIVLILPKAAIGSSLLPCNIVKSDLSPNEPGLKVYAVQGYGLDQYVKIQVKKYSSGEEYLCGERDLLHLSKMYDVSGYFGVGMFLDGHPIIGLDESQFSYARPLKMISLKELKRAGIEKNGNSYQIKLRNGTSIWFKKNELFILQDELVNNQLFREIGKVSSEYPIVINPTLLFLEKKEKLLHEYGYIPVKGKGLFPITPEIIHRLFDLNEENGYLVQYPRSSPAFYPVNYAWIPELRDIDGGLFLLFPGVKGEKLEQLIMKDKYCLRLKYGTRCYTYEKLTINLLELSKNIDLRFVKGEERQNSKVKLYLAFDANLGDLFANRSVTRRILTDMNGNDYIIVRKSHSGEAYVFLDEINDSCTAKQEEYCSLYKKLYSNQ